MKNKFQQLKNCGILFFAALFAVALALPAVSKAKNTDSVRYVATQATGAAKTTALKTRIVGHSYRPSVITGLVTDSATWTYSGLRGSFFANSKENENALYGITISSKPDVFVRILPNFTSNIYRYDTSGNVLIDSSLIYVYKTEYTYNAANQLAYKIYSDTTGGGLSAKRKEYFVYNAAGKVATDSVSIYTGTGWVASYKFQSSYDANGNLLEQIGTSNNGSAWVWYYRYVAVYNANNKYIKVIQYDATGPFGAQTWVLRDKDTFGYTGSNPIVTYSARYSRNTVANTWVGTGYQMDYKLNAQGNYDTSFYHTWDTATAGWKLMEKDYYQYNSDNLIVHSGGFNYHAATNTYDPAPYDQQSYYYETYNDPTAVASVTAAADNALSLYPNPAPEQITIALKDLAAVNVFNLSGQRVAVGVVNGGKARINTAMLPAGLYYVQAINAAGIQKAAQFIR